MKKRRVFVTLELDTDVPLRELRRARWWSDSLQKLKTTSVEQAQANVAAPKKKKR